MICFTRKAIISLATAIATLLIGTIPSLAESFKFSSADWICEITGKTSEEATIIRQLKASVNDSMVHIERIYVGCNAFDNIKNGSTEAILPIITLQVSKTDGKILPFSTITNKNLKEKIADFLPYYKWSEDQKRAVSTFQNILNERNSTVPFDFLITPPVIIDNSDSTVSVAQNSRMSVGASEIEATAIATSTVVDGYVVTATITDQAKTPKDFWRMQLETEILARQIQRVNNSQGDVSKVDDFIYNVVTEWQHSFDKSGGRLIFLPPKAPANEENSPILVVRCNGNTTSAYVWFQSGSTAKPGAHADAVLMVDDELRHDIWSGGADGRFVGKWFGQDAIPLVKSLFSHSDLKLQINGKGFPQETLSFNIKGIETAVSPVRQDCGW